MIEFVDSHPFITVLIILVAADIIPKTIGYVCKTIMICVSMITGHDVKFEEKEKM